MRSPYDGIEVHSDYMEKPKMAVDVKTHGMTFPDVEGETSQLRERAWDICVETFWDEAANIAHERGYSGVFSEGRSSGWCVPFYQRTSAGRTKFGGSAGRWPGQGGDMGYPTYPDIENLAERQRFRGFRRRIEKLMKELLDYYGEVLTHLVDQEKSAA